jgi:putative ABC transport system substrate-binding protein
VLALRAKVNAAALAAGLPIMQLFRFAIVPDGFLSYGPDILDLYRRAVALVDKVLRGTKPADIPIEQPIKYELVVNLKTREGARADNPRILPHARRRGDRMKRR